jgi:DNA-binding MarR family transcriptional regulator
VPGDTSPAADARYHELLRAQSPAARLEQAAALTRAVRQLAEAGIRQRHPGASDAEVRVRLTVRLYGREVAARLFGAVPADAI